jgi:hypothetical protein
MPMERARESGRGGTKVVTPPSPARVIAGRAPAARASTACPSSCTRIAAVATSTQTTSPGIVVPAE